MSQKHENCIFCSKLVKPQPVDGMNAVEYRCIQCGNYILDNSFKNILNTENNCYITKKHLISGYLAETKTNMNYTGKSDEEYLQRYYIDEKKFKSILADLIVPKTVIHKLDKLLIYLHNNTERFGKEWYIDKIPLSAAYVSDKSEVIAIVKEAVIMNYGRYKECIPGTYGYGGGGTSPKDIELNTNIFILNINGHSRAEELLTKNPDSKNVFVAMGFVKDLLNAMDLAIKPACYECGFNAFLIKDKEYNNGITDEIIVAIKTSKFVITDFTYNNCGAYFEAGYAQGFGLEVIRCCNQEWFDSVDDKGNKNKLHFDINHYNFILWKNELDLKSKLINRIRATIPDANMEYCI